MEHGKNISLQQRIAKLLITINARREEIAELKKQRLMLTELHELYIHNRQNMKAAHGNLPVKNNARLTGNE